MCDTQSHYSDEDLEMGDGFESPVHPTQTNSKIVTTQINNSSPSGTGQKLVAGKMESGWKKKVKTELCRFWLSGHDCENSSKE